MDDSRKVPAIRCLWLVEGEPCAEIAHMTMVGPLYIHFECQAGHAFHTPLDCTGFRPCTCEPPMDNWDEWWLNVA